MLTDRQSCLIHALHSCAVAERPIPTKIDRQRQQDDPIHAGTADATYWQRCVDDQWYGQDWTGQGERY